MHTFIYSYSMHMSCKHTETQKLFTSKNSFWSPFSLARLGYFSPCYLVLFDYLLNERNRFKKCNLGPLKDLQSLNGLWGFWIKTYSKKPWLWDGLMKLQILQGGNHFFFPFIEHVIGKTSRPFQSRNLVCMRSFFAGIIRRNVLTDRRWDIQKFTLEQKSLN